MKNKAVSGTMLALLLMGVLSASFGIEETSASPIVRIYVDMPLGYIPGVPPGPLPSGFVFVDLYIDTDIPDNTPQGIVQWAISVHVDPTVLEPMAVQGAQPGYFLNDFLTRYFYDFMGYGVGLMPPVIDKEAGIMLWATERIIGQPPIPNGAGAVPGQMPYKLCTLVFNSLSETEYSPIDLYYEVGVDAWYWTAESGVDAFPVDVVDDGHYNMPPNGYLFEIPQGGMFPPGDPTFSDWHELDPVFCQNWTLESWIDGGDGLLSPSDQIAMFRMEPPQPGPDPTWFHVEWVNPAPIAGDGIPDLLVTEISPGIPPLASFTFSPAEPVVDEMVTFDASASNDPDGTVVSYAWDFGDGTFGSGVIVHHAYVSEGDYSVTLTITDNDGLTDTATAVITVSPVEVHDIAVISVSASPTQVPAGELVTITATVINQGDFSEVFSLIAYYDATMIEAANVTLNAGETVTETSTWDTTGVPPDTYSIRAEATVVEGEVDTSDNMLVDGTVTVTLPPAPPILSIKLSGEHDYAIMENVKVRLAALVKDATTMEPVSDANVTIKIYDPDGVLWVSDVMVEMVAGTGIYEWESEGTIRELRLGKGVYLVHVQASCQEAPTASDILAFHIDPPAEGTSQTLYLLAFAAVALAGLAGLILSRQQVASRLGRLNGRN